jgi:hypothetical protein
MAGSKLINIIQNAGKMSTGETTDLLFGDVTSISPLKIKIDNRFEVDEKFLILSTLVKETTISALPDIILWRGLRVGDKVRVLRVNKGQMFYVMEREEEID